MEQNSKKEFKRGDVFFVEKDDGDFFVPGEQSRGRPAVIIQNDKGNMHSPTVIVSYLTSKRKKFLPTHVLTTNTCCWSTILCEQIDTISKTRLTRFVCHLSERDMKRVDKAVSISLGLREV